MNCHGNNNQNNNKGKGNGHKGHLGHMLMMALCCGAPVIILLLVPLIGRIGGGSGFSKALLAIAPFLCPVMMLFMIPMMFKGNKNKENNGDFHQNKQLQPGEKVRDLE